MFLLKHLYKCHQRVKCIVSCRYHSSFKHQRLDRYGSTILELLQYSCVKLYSLKIHVFSFVFEVFYKTTFSLCHNEPKPSKLIVCLRQLCYSRNYLYIKALYSSTCVLLNFYLCTIHIKCRLLFMYVYYCTQMKCRFFLCLSMYTDKVPIFYMSIYVHS